MDIKTLSIEELKSLFKEIQNELESRQEKKSKIIELSYNQYKGSGKCWIARVDSETKKIIKFLDAESKQPRDNYSGIKTFSVPLIEGVVYLFNESGSKSSDSRCYKKIINGELCKI